MSNVETFEDLRIWQEARGLVKEIYSDVGRGTPAGTDYGFISQIQRAGISIMNNIAEGFERSSDADFLDLLIFQRGHVERFEACTTRQKIWDILQPILHINDVIKRNKSREEWHH